MHGWDSQECPILTISCTLEPTQRNKLSIASAHKTFCIPIVFVITLEFLLSGITHLKLLIQLIEHSIADHSPILILIVKLKRGLSKFPRMALNCL